MSEETKPENQNSRREIATEHFPEDSHAPKSAGNQEPGADSAKETITDGQSLPSEQQTIQLPTANTEPEIQIMEVHKHPHHVMHKKKWKEYVLEFLMLFLAVFLGFLAENVREGRVEQHREGQYMRSMIEDLQRDSSMLKKNVALRQQRIMMIDSLVAMLSAPGHDNYGNDIYFFARSISPPANIFPNDGTIQQLKSSGNLRLIRDSHIATSIMAYDQTMRNVLFEMEDEVQIRAEYRQLGRKLFRATIFHDMIAGDTITRPTNNPQLYTEDAASINEFIGQCQYFKRVHQSQLIRSEGLLAQSKQLIADIKQEYHLD